MLRAVGPPPYVSLEMSDDHCPKKGGCGPVGWVVRQGHARHGVDMAWTAGLTPQLGKCCLRGPQMCQRPWPPSQDDQPCSRKGPRQILCHLFLKKC